ncbi:MAG TPA: flagellar motor switch protein FliN [Desulfobacterales bacterium]|nr:flagellar motor switch protein FliN [Desulfobacterales bacterium]HIP39824.1 flagellar motor switch protein FliN [Desulfocapsa sulfexigens]
MTDEAIQESSKPQPEEIKELLDDEGMETETVTQAEDNSPAPEPSLANHKDRGLGFLYDVPLQISVEVGRSKILLKDLLQMGEGYIIELDKLAGDPLDLYVNSRLIAKGEAVMVGDKFGIRLTDVISPCDRVEQLG